MMMKYLDCPLKQKASLLLSLGMRQRNLGFLLSAFVVPASGVPD